MWLVESGTGWRSSTAGSSSAFPRSRRPLLSPSTRRSTEWPTRAAFFSTATSSCFWTDLMDRRDFLFRAAGGMGGLALTHLLGQQGLFGQEPKPDLNGGLHHRA